MMPDPRPVCVRCEKREAKAIERLLSEYRNLQSAVDALTEALEDAEYLCEALGWYLQQYDPDFVEKMDPDDIELWEIVAPFGVDDGTAD